MTFFSLPFKNQSQSDILLKQNGDKPITNKLLLF